jgi:hypothetical protein
MADTVDKGPERDQALRRQGVDGGRVTLLGRRLPGWAGLLTPTELTQVTRTQARAMAAGAVAAPLS